jgi:hypothetical protein
MMTWLKWHAVHADFNSNLAITVSYTNAWKIYIYKDVQTDRRNHKRCNTEMYPMKYNDCPITVSYNTFRYSAWDLRFSQRWICRCWSSQHQRFNLQDGGSMFPCNVVIQYKFTWRYHPEHQHQHLSIFHIYRNTAYLYKQVIAPYKHLPT